MDIKLIKELTKLMRDNELVELEVESPDLKVKLSKAAPMVAASHPVMVHAQPAAPAPVAAAAAAAVQAAAPAADEFPNAKKITSPIPGTVYLRPNPESPEFVSLGGQVKEGQTVCLIEAMKVFNEIKAEGVSGTIKKICVSDGQAVEYGTVLFLVG